MKYLTAREIASILGISRRAVAKRAQKENWPFIEDKSNRGKKRKKYIIENLPDDIRGSIINGTNNGTYQTHTGCGFASDNGTDNGTGNDSNQLAQTFDITRKTTKNEFAEPIAEPIAELLRNQRKSVPFQDISTTYGFLNHEVDCDNATDVRIPFEWIPVNIAASLEGITERTIRKRIDKGEYDSSKLKLQASKGGKHGRRWLIHVSALSIEGQRRYYERCGMLPRKAPKEAMYLSERTKRKALAKYQLVKEWRNSILKNKGKLKSDITKEFLRAYNTGSLLPDVYAILGHIHQSTLYRWDAVLRESEDDYTVLADSRGGWRWKGRRKLRKETQKVLLCCYLQPHKPSVQLAIRAARYVLAKRGIDEEASDATLRRWLEDWRKKNGHIECLARDGEKAFMDIYGPYITRNTDALRVGDVFVADGHVLNFMVIHPETGRPFRPTLIVFFDWASRYPVGWELMPTENTIAISVALRRAIERAGCIPRVVYLDNGKAFRARYFTSVDDFDFGALAGVYARLGIATMFSEPYNARAKVVERFFLTMSEQCERIVPSYCGRNIDDRPAWMKQNEKFHKAWHESKTKGWIPTIREAARIIASYIDWYGKQTHAGLKGKTPEEVLTEGMGKGVDRNFLGWEFYWRKMVTPRRCRVRLFGVDFEGDCLLGINEKVVVYYDHADLSRVLVTTIDGEFLGELTPVQAIHPVAHLFADAVSVDALKRAIERQRRAKKKAKEALKLIAPDMVNMLPRDKIVPIGGEEILPERDERKRKEDHRRLLKLVESLGKEGEEQEEKDEHKRPEFFRSEIERYDWCWRRKHQHGKELDEADESFMRYFETQPEFEMYRKRYEMLKELYGGRQ